VEGMEGKEDTDGEGGQFLHNKLHIGGGDGAVAGRLPQVVPSGACLPDPPKVTSRVS
jgi:hypothetical protein